VWVDRVWGTGEWDNIDIKQGIITGPRHTNRIGNGQGGDEGRRRKREEKSKERSEWTSECLDGGSVSLFDFVHTIVDMFAYECNE
jgi:hypothetical protein